MNYSSFAYNLVLMSFYLKTVYKSLNTEIRVVLVFCCIYQQLNILETATCFSCFFLFKVALFDNVEMKSGVV